MFDFDRVLVEKRSDLIRQEYIFAFLGLPQSAVNGFHSGSVLLGAANAIEDDAKASSSDTIISMDGIQVYEMFQRINKCRCKNVMISSFVCISIMITLFSAFSARSTHVAWRH